MTEVDVKKCRENSREGRRERRRSRGEGLGKVEDPTEAQRVSFTLQIFLIQSN